MTLREENASALTARRALLLFLLVLVLRVAIAAQFRGNYDTRSYLIVAEATLRGENVYAATDRYNYSPVWSFVVAALWWLARPNQGLFILLAGLLQTLADVATAALVYRISRDRLGLDAEASRRAALLFFSNPVSVAVSCGQGQFDGSAIVFLLAAIWVATSPDGKRKGPAVVGLLSVSLLVKHVTAFHPFLFWRRWRPGGLSLAAVLVPYLVFALSFVPYRLALGKIGQNVLLYPTFLTGSKGQYPGGLTSLLSFPGGSALAFNVIALAVLGWVIATSRAMELPRASLLLSLAVLTFLPSFAMQYLVWPVALGCLYASPALGLYSGVAALHHSALGLRLAWPVKVGTLGAWVAGLLWFLAEAAAARRLTATPTSR